MSAHTHLTDTNSDQDRSQILDHTHGGRAQDAPERAIGWSFTFAMLAAVIALLLLTIVRGPVLSLNGTVEAWASITVAIVMQAVPFLVFGVIVSGAISAFVPDSFLRHITPDNPFFAVPAAAGAGFLLPGCECASVPVAQSLMRRNIPTAAALTFLLASPAINPVVLVSTAVAFQGHPKMVLGRLAASIIAAIIVGWGWIILGGKIPMSHIHAHSHAGRNKWDAFRASALHDLMNAGGYLSMGAMVAALIKVTVPKAWFDTVNEHQVVACLIMGILAVVLSLCSEADAFIAASFTHVSPVAQLVFLVVGPMVDIKLFFMQYGAWGEGFVVRFAPSVFTVATLVGIAVGFVLFAV